MITVNKAVDKIGYIFQWIQWQTLRASLSVAIKRRWLTIDVINFKKLFFLKDYSIWNFVIAFTKFPGLLVTLAQTTTTKKSLYLITSYQCCYGFSVLEVSCMEGGSDVSLFQICFFFLGTPAHHTIQQKHRPSVSHPSNTCIQEDLYK